MQHHNPVVLAIIVLVVSVLCLVSSDSKVSIADTNIPNDIASSVNQTDSPLSANATITITMRTPPLPNK